MTTKNDRIATRQAKLQQLSDLPVLLDEADVLEILGISTRRLNNLIREGRLENCVLFGDRRLFRKEQVRALLAA